MPDSEANAKQLSVDEFTQIVSSLGPALVLYARQLCDHAEDVAQEALLLLQLQRPPPDNVRAWLYRVVRNRSLNNVRHENRRRKLEHQVARERQAWFDSSVPCQVDIEQAVSALKRLPEDQREAIVARLWGGLTLEEIAALTQASIATVQRRYVRGLERLRQQLNDEIMKVDRVCQEKT